MSSLVWAVALSLFRLTFCESLTADNLVECSRNSIPQLTYREDVLFFEGYGVNHVPRDLESKDGLRAKRQDNGRDPPISWGGSGRPHGGGGDMSKDPVIGNLETFRCHREYPMASGELVNIYVKVDYLEIGDCSVRLTIYSVNNPSGKVLFDCSSTNRNLYRFRGQRLAVDLQYKAAAYPRPRFDFTFGVSELHPDHWPSSMEDRHTPGNLPTPPDGRGPLTVWQGETKMALTVLICIGLTAAFIFIIVKICRHNDKIRRRRQALRLRRANQIGTGETEMTTDEPDNRIGPYPHLTGPPSLMTPPTYDSVVISGDYMKPPSYTHAISQRASDNTLLEQQTDRLPMDGFDGHHGNCHPSAPDYDPQYPSDGSNGYPIDYPHNVSDGHLSNQPRLHSNTEAIDSSGNHSSNHLDDLSNSHLSSYPNNQHVYLHGEDPRTMDAPRIIHGREPSTSGACYSSEPPSAEVSNRESGSSGATEAISSPPTLSPPSCDLSTEVLGDRFSSSCDHAAIHDSEGGGEAQVERDRVEHVKLPSLSSADAWSEEAKAEDETITTTVV